MKLRALPTNPKGKNSRVGEANVRRAHRPTRRLGVKVRCSREDSPHHGIIQPSRRMRLVCGQGSKFKDLTLRGDSPLRSSRERRKNTRGNGHTRDHSAAALPAELVQKVMYATDLYRRAIPAVQKQLRREANRSYSGLRNDRHPSGYGCPVDRGSPELTLSLIAPARKTIYRVVGDARCTHWDPPANRFVRSIARYGFSRGILPIGIWRVWDA